MNSREPSQNREDLHRYLNDHLAGSVAALELLRHLVATTEDVELCSTFRSLMREIEADRTELEATLQQCGGQQEKTRQTAAWFLEKIGWTKFKPGNFPAAGLGLLEALEALSLGILGKRALWRALAGVASFQRQDFIRLIRRAEEQFGRVEARRLAVANQILS